MVRNFTSSILRRTGLILIIAATPILPLRAVILYGTGDPTADMTAPTGAYANSGWQFEGQFNGFLGTVIAPNYFITAKHIGGAVGNTFNFNGTNYPTTAVFPDPSSDLQIWRVSGTFPIQAPLYADSPGTEVNLFLMVFGRGTQRGNSVFVGSDSHLGGWRWGTSDAVQRWGTNTVGSIVNDPTYGALLRVPFNNNALDEAHLSVGDSGGAVFVYDLTTSRWELAGINLAVDGPFSTSATGANSFNAAMFDTTGLFVDGGHGTWVAAENPSAFYATEISAHRQFIESTVMQATHLASRKTHGNAGTFDVDLPLSGKPGIECRSGGATNDYMLVLTFASNVSMQNATVISGTGSATNFTVLGNIVTVNLNGITNAQTITVKLTGVSDGTNTSDVEVSMSVLVGDTNGDGFVDAVDTSQTKSQSGNAVSKSDCREDVNVDGFIDSVDTSFVKAESGTTLPASGTMRMLVRPAHVTPLDVHLNGPNKIQRRFEDKVPER
jgi:dockerin type I repeat protein